MYYGYHGFQHVTYLDPFGNITTSDVNIVGHVFGGDEANMQLVSGTTVYATVPEPGCLGLLALGLAGVALRRKH